MFALPSSTFIESGFSAVHPPGPAAPEVHPTWNVGPPVPTVTPPDAPPAVAFAAWAPGSPGAGVMAVPPAAAVVKYFLSRYEMPDRAVSPAPFPPTRMDWTAMVRVPGLMNIASISVFGVPLVTNGVATDQFGVMYTNGILPSLERRLP